MIIQQTKSIEFLISTNVPSKASWLGFGDGLHNGYAGQKVREGLNLPKRQHALKLESQNRRTPMPGGLASSTESEL
jgi:hypothetical protein